MCCIIFWLSSLVSRAMTLLSSHHLLAFSAVHRRRHSPATTTHLHRYKPTTTTTDTVRFPCSPVVPAVLRLGERVSVSAFVISANAHDLLHNAGATVGVLGGAYTLVFAFDDLTRRKIIKQVMDSSLLLHLHACFTIFKKNNESIYCLFDSIWILGFVCWWKFLCLVGNWWHMAESEQKTCPYLIWLAFPGFLAHFQVPHFCVCVSD